MEKIRQAIDTRLAGQHLPETVYDALCARPARRSRVRRAAALLAAVCVLGGATALAAARLFGMNVNGRELPPLEPMTMVETADTGGPADGTEQQAEGLDALSRALGVPFLWAEGARENPYTRVSYQNFDRKGKGVPGGRLEGPCLAGRIRLLLLDGGHGVPDACGPDAGMGLR